MFVERFIPPPVIELKVTFRANSIVDTFTVEAPGDFMLLKIGELIFNVICFVSDFEIFPEKLISDESFVVRETSLFFTLELRTMSPL